MVSLFRNVRWFFSPCIICIYLPCSLTQCPQRLYVWRTSLPMMRPEMSAKMHFLPGGMKPGSAEDFCTGCIFNLKLDPELQSYNFAHGSFSSFIRLPAACHYSTQVLNSLITLKVMVFSFLKDESLGFSLSVHPARCRQQLVTGELQHIDTRC